VLNTAELHDYLAGQGEWVLSPDALSSSSSISNATAGAAAGVTVQQHAALGRVVAELAALSQKLQGKQLALPAPAAVAGDAGAEGAGSVLTAAAAAAEQSPEDAATATIKAMLLKLAVVSIGSAALLSRKDCVIAHKHTRSAHWMH
jgi:hypothetical protein